MFNTTHFGDCMELLNEIPDNSIPLICSDLPYSITSNPKDILIPMEDHITRQTKSNKKVYITFQMFLLECFKAKLDYKKSVELWNQNHTKGLWHHFNRILAPTGNCVLFCQSSYMAYLMNSNSKMYRYDVVWDKKLVTGHLDCKWRPMRQHENYLVFNKSAKKATYNPQFTQGIPLHSKGTSYKDKEMVNQNYGSFHVTEDTRKGSTDKYPTTILQYQKPTAATSRHRSEKPISLLSNIIKTYSNEGDAVLDCCAGSGSTGEAALATNRKYILIENDLSEYNKLLENISTFKATNENQTDNG